MELDNDILWQSHLPKTADALKSKHQLDVATVAVHPILQRDIREFSPFVLISTVKSDHKKRRDVDNFLAGADDLTEDTVIIDCVAPDLSPLQKAKVYCVDLSENSGSLRFVNRNLVERWVWDLIAFDVINRVRGLIVRANSMKNIPAVWCTLSQLGFIDPRTEDPNLALLKGMGNFFDTIDPDSVPTDEVLGWIKHVESTKITQF